VNASLVPTYRYVSKDGTSRERKKEAKKVGRELCKPGGEGEERRPGGPPNSGPGIYRCNKVVTKLYRSIIAGRCTNALSKLDQSGRAQA
jgi:hypothetical protein